MLTPRATIDFETRSTVSLKKCGAWRYAVDPTTCILCLAFHLPTWPKDRTGLWYPAFPTLNLPERIDADLEELFTWILQGGLVEAHNVWFEYCIWRHVFVEQHGAPEIAIPQWRCSAAKAAACALPRGLDDALTAMRLSIRKDPQGQKLIHKLTKPRKPRKKEWELWAKQSSDPHPTLYWDDLKLFQQLWAYCRQDVIAEVALSHALPDLSPSETDLFLMDLRINDRGFQIDRQAVTTAQTLIEQETRVLNRELVKVTKGRVKKATARAQMLRWFQSQGLPLDNTQKGTLDGLLVGQSGDGTAGLQLTPSVQRALEIVRTLGRSSTAKYDAMAAWADPHDGRVRGALRYHGATTGRWAGTGVQPHNFPKGTLAEKDMGHLWDVLNTRKRSTIMTAYPSVMEALAHGIRGAIIAAPGHVLCVADYAAIEARIVLWLADDQEALQLFRTQQDIYCSMATDIYHYPCTKSHASERALGKIAVLGLGYQMGAAKFMTTAATFGITITEEFAQEVVATYRDRFWRVRDMWAEQQAVAIEAVESRQPIECGRITWKVEKPFLSCYLPSGRRLAYPFPEIRTRQTPWGSLQPTLTYMGMDPYTHQWKRQVTYGGMLVENQTQAVARDIMAEAMLRCEAGGYPLVLSVHDELGAEIQEGSLDEFLQLLTEPPLWARDCPIEAAGWIGQRYHK